MEDRVLVLGAGFAGINTALRLDRRGFDVEVVDQNSYHEYKPGIIDIYNDRVPEDKMRLNLPEFFSDTDIHFSREIVEDIRPEDNAVDTSAGTHEYHYLVVALGGQQRDFGMDISKAENPYNLRETKKIKRKLEDVEEILIVGSGYVGIEIAAEINMNGQEVTVLDQSTRPMPASNEKASHKALDYMNKNDINFRGGQEVVKVGKDYVKTKDGKKIEADMVIWSGGVKASELVSKSFDVDGRGIPADENLQYHKHPNVFAVGDCADTDAVETAHNSLVQAKVVGKNVGKPKQRMSEFESSTPTLLVSLGGTGMILRGGLAFRNRFFRYAKDLVRKGYWFQLKASKILN